MLWVVVVALAIWFGGQRLGWPVPLRRGLIAVLWAGVMALLLALPDGNALARSIGGGVVEWGVLGLGALVVWAYAGWLRWLKARVRAPTVARAGPFSDEELQRYSRQILLQDIGGPGQKKLKAARVLVIGAGGLGSPVLQYLAAAGVGTIGVIDDDEVDLSNLHRQVIHAADTVGTPKVRSALEAVQRQNPNVTLRPYRRRLTEDIAADLFADYDLILDGTDNFATRYLANRVAAAQGKPLIGGALTQWEGQVSVWDPARGGPCYECIFPEAPAPGLVPSCAEAGVAGPLPGVIGSMMALEAVKAITGAGEGLCGRMLIWDGLHAEARVIRLDKRAGCPVCG
jgi:molybdopterin/thiamine biosynthesis adenylyltransferase